MPLARKTPVAMAIDANAGIARPVWYSCKSRVMNGHILLSRSDRGSFEA